MATTYTTESFTIDGVNLYINRKQNSTTKCLLQPSRRIFKVRNINIL